MKKKNRTEEVKTFSEALNNLEKEIKKGFEPIIDYMERHKVLTTIFFVTVLTFIFTSGC